MNSYDFDTVTDRRGTSCLKYDFKAERGYPENVLPLWVADMDYPTAPEIVEAIQKTASHGIFGYTVPKQEYFDTVLKWYAERFDYRPDSRSCVITPGVVFAISAAVRAFTKEGDAVLIQPPVYYPFFSAVTENGRRLAENELVYHDGKYSIDFEDFECKVKENEVKLFILCSPHNPVGRVWTEEELRHLGEICERYGVTVISDEIHSDFVREGHRHTVFTNACPRLKSRTVVCTAPSKSFNLAGLQVSHIFIENARLRHRFKAVLSAQGYTEVNTLGLSASRAAYEKGGEWLAQCREYIEGNLQFAKTFLAERLPMLRLVEPEGTYFAWIDFSALGLDRQALNGLIIHKAHLWLDAGHIFGAASDQFQRIVLACPRAILRQALEQLEKAVKEELQ